MKTTRYLRMLAPGLTVLMVLAGAPLVAAPADFDRANALYEAGKYEDAANAYEEAIDAGAISANAYYNLGDSCFRLGERGLAVLNYERALVLQPGHAEAAANLAFVRRQLGVSTVSAGWPPFVDRWLTAPVAAWIANAGLWLVAAGFIVAAWWRLAKRERVNGLIIAAAGVPLLALGAAGSWAAWGATGDPARAVIIVPNAEARYAPVDNSKVESTLPEGSELRVLLERGGWTYVELPDGRRAWLAAGAVEKVVPGKQGIRK